EDLYVGVRLGMMIPYCGNELPKGFVWADGKTRWPRAAWVPQHLWGELVPDMTSCLIGGAPDAKKVGKLWQEGKVAVSGVTVRGSNFKLPAKRTEERIAPGLGLNNAGGYVGIFNNNADYKGEKGIFWSGFGGTFDSRPAVYSTFGAAEAL